MCVVTAIERKYREIKETIREGDLRMLLAIYKRISAGDLQTNIMYAQSTREISIPRQSFHAPLSRFSHGKPTTKTTLR